MLVPELRKSESIDDAMSVISNYCSFFNYRIVERIIDNLGTEQDRKNVSNYKEEFIKYARRHVFKCPSEVGQISETGHADMFVTLDVTYDSYTINHLCALVSNLQRVLKIPAEQLKRCRIMPGSLKLLFQIPQQAIFPLSSDQKSELTGLGVVEISCRDYQFTRDKDQVYR